MHQPSCIFTYGQSIFIQAIIAGLQARSDVELRDFDPHHPLAGTLLRQACPMLLIIEVGGNEDWVMGDLLAADIPILVVNISSGRSRLLTSTALPLDQNNAHGLGHLLALINQIESVHDVEPKGKG